MYVGLQCRGSGRRMLGNLPRWGGGVYVCRKPEEVSAVPCHTYDWVLIVAPRRRVVPEPGTYRGSAMGRQRGTMSPLDSRSGPRSSQLWFRSIARS